jgi:hypothetical protein
MLYKTADKAWPSTKNLQTFLGMCSRLDWPWPWVAGTAGYVIDGKHVGQHGSWIDSANLLRKVKFMKEKNENLVLLLLLNFGTRIHRPTQHPIPLVSRTNKSLRSLAT